MSHEPPREGTDRLLIKPTGWARPVSAPWEDKSKSRHTEVARSALSHSQVPPPILAQPPPRPTHQHSQIRADSGADEVGDSCPACHIPGKMIRAVDVDPRDRGGVAQSILSRAAGVMSASDTGAPVRWFE
jgi:hypothetical protein